MLFIFLEPSPKQEIGFPQAFYWFRKPELIQPTSIMTHFLALSPRLRLGISLEVRTLLAERLA